MYRTYGTNYPQLKQTTRVTSMSYHTRVVFVSHTCCFCGMGGCLATHACGYTCVHAQIFLHTCVPTRTQSVYTQVLLLVSHSMYILQSSCFLRVINTCSGFSEVFSLQDWAPDYMQSRGPTVLLILNLTHMCACTH